MILKAIQKYEDQRGNSMFRPPLSTSKTSPVIEHINLLILLKKPNYPSFALVIVKKGVGIYFGCGKKRVQNVTLSNMLNIVLNIRRFRYIPTIS